ncbi:hypothetical protein D3C86_1842690 [compost metagenome]
MAAAFKQVQYLTFNGNFFSRFRMVYFLKEIKQLRIIFPDLDGQCTLGRGRYQFSSVYNLYMKFRKFNI